MKQFKDHIKDTQEKIELTIAALHGVNKIFKAIDFDVEPTPKEFEEISALHRNAGFMYEAALNCGIFKKVLAAFAVSWRKGTKNG